MPVKKIIDQLLESEEFKEWKKETGHEKYFLAHVFKLFDEPNKNIYQIGYFDEKTEHMTTFVIEASEDFSINKVGVSTDTEVFKKPDSKISKLDPEKVKIDLPTALGTAADLQKKEYSQHPPMKQFLILQNLECGQVYNITFLTQTFKTLNIKVDAASGEILKHDMMSLMDFKAD